MKFIGYPSSDKRSFTGGMIVSDEYSFREVCSGLHLKHFREDKRRMNVRYMLIKDMDGNMVGWV